MGLEGRRSEIPRWEMMEGDTIYIEWKRRQAIQNTEMGTDGSQYDIQRWELITGNTIFGDGN